RRNSDRHTSGRRCVSHSRPPTPRTSDSISNREDRYLAPIFIACLKDAWLLRSPQAISDSVLRLLANRLRLTESCIAIVPIPTKLDRGIPWLRLMMREQSSPPLSGKPQPSVNR